MSSTLFATISGKKIVFVFGKLEFGGAERQGMLLAQYLHRECKARVTVIALQGGPGRLVKVCEEIGIPWRSLRLGRIRTRCEWLRGLFGFIWMMRRENPDLLISYTKTANILAALAWRILAAKGCIWNQADEGLGMGRAPLNRLAVSLTRCFISNSTGGKSFLQKSYSVPDTKVTVIHNGITLAPPAGSRQEWRRNLGIADETFVATMVANITKFKDHKTLLNAWQIVLRRRPMLPAPILLLAGRFDGPEQDLIKMVNEMGINNQVKFLGEVSDVSGLLGISDLFVYSSVSEGLPNAVVEAMSVGLPVVGTDIPGIREAVGTDYRFLAPVGDPENLARMIGQFIIDPTLRSQHGHALKARAEANFGIARLFEQSVEVIANQMGYNDDV